MITNYEIKNCNGQFASFLQDALLMAKLAGDIQMKYFRSGKLVQQTKYNDSDVVTNADKESEAVIIDFIKGKYPEHGIISEESGRENENKEWRWVVDPLDGTTNFSTGIPVFSVSIALERNGEAVVGVVYAPYFDECFYAMKGGGAWLNGDAIHCSEKDVLSRAVVATGVPYDRNENPDNNLREISQITLKVRGVRRMGSAAIDICYTAAGFFDAYWELNLNRWDVAAGVLIAKEAGAEIQSLRSDRNYSLLVSNQLLFQKMYDLLR